MLRCERARGRAALWDIHIDRLVIRSFDSEGANEIRDELRALNNRLARIEWKVNRIMGTTAEALEVIGQIRTDTDRVADKLDALADRPDVNDEVTAALRDAGSHLRGVASAFDPVEPTPDVIPGSEPLPEGGDEGVPPITGPTDNPADPSAPTT